MMDLQRKRLIEEFDEATLKLLMDEYEVIEGMRLWSEYLVALESKKCPEIPDELDIQCKKLICARFSN